MMSPRTRQNLIREFKDSHLAKIGIFLVVLVVFVAVFAPFLAPYNPTITHVKQAQLPPLGFSKAVTTTHPKMEGGTMSIVTKTKYIEATWAHPLGTDALGRDILSRVIYGARVSMLVGILGTAIAALIGTTVGLFAGYYGGRVDDALMRSADIMLAFPSLVLAVALVGMFGTATVKIPDPWVALGLVSGMPPYILLPGTVILVVGLVSWVWFARIARGEALTLVGEEYVKSARSVGASDRFIIRKHVLPNAITPLLVLATIQIAVIIILEASLSFLGFSGTTLSWGFSIASGRDYLATAWWVSTMPGIAILITVVGINLVGDWLRDALDPGIEGETGGA